MDKYINTIIEINIGYNYSKYHTKISHKISHKISNNYSIKIAKNIKILTAKNAKNRHKKHNTIIAIYRNISKKSQHKKNLKPKSYTIIETIIGYYINVSRGT